MDFHGFSLLSSKFEPIIEAPNDELVKPFEQDGNRQIGSCLVMGLGRGMS
jgi:hypothetical protein